LLAEHFISNPKNHRHIIFKDRNNHNCIVENIAWVDRQTFMYYAGLTKFQTGRKKVVVDRNEAIRICSDVYLKQYYKTLDEYWLVKGWKQVEAKVKVADWEHLKSESYMYFIDRAKRFSILKNPVGLISCI